MITVAMELSSGGEVEFNCPHCKAPDILYMRMHEICWRCGKLYEVHVADLIDYQEDRVYYHRYRRTARLP